MPGPLPPSVQLRILELAFPLPSVIHGPNDAAGYKALRALVRSAAGTRGDVLSAAAAEVTRSMVMLGAGGTLGQCMQAFDDSVVDAADIRIVQIQRRNVRDGDRARMLGVLARCVGATTLIIEEHEPKLLAAADISLPAMRELLLGYRDDRDVGTAEALDICRIAARHVGLRRLHLVVSASFAAALETHSLIPLAHVTELMVTGVSFAPAAFYAPALRMLDVSAELTLSDVAGQTLAAACPLLEHLVIRHNPVIDLQALFAELPATLRSLSVYFSRYEWPRRIRDAQLDAAGAIEAGVIPPALRLLAVGAVTDAAGMSGPSQPEAVDKLRTACSANGIELCERPCVVRGPRLY